MDMSKHIRRLYLAVGALGLVVIALVVVGRIEQAHRNDTLRLVVCYAEETQLAQPKLSPVARSAIIQFWNGDLKFAHLSPPCSLP